MLLVELREQIVEIGLQLMQDKLVHHGQGNMSIMDRKSGYIAITPSALPYHKRTAEDICVVDLENRLVDGKRKPTSEIALHLVFYLNRQEINAVVHSHAPFSTIFSITGEKYLPMVLNESAMCLGSPLPVAPYARPGTQELAQITFQGMGRGIGALMAHHGLVTIGETLDQAFNATVAAEATANALVMARAMGANVQILDETEVTCLKNIYQHHVACPKDNVSIELIQRVKDAVLARLGNRVEPELINSVVTRVINEISL